MTIFPWGCMERRPEKTGKQDSDAASEFAGSCPQALSFSDLFLRHRFPEPALSIAMSLAFNPRSPDHTLTRNLGIQDKVMHSDLRKQPG